MVLGVDLTSSNGIELVSKGEADARGVVSCGGAVGRFCVVLVRAAPASSGNKGLTFNLRVADVLNPTQVDIVGPFSANATAQDAPVVLSDKFTTVSLTDRAQRAGMTKLQYLRDQFSKISPATFVTDTTDFHSPLTSDALVFSGFSIADSKVFWRRNWANSVFDFTGMAWDSGGYTDLDYRGGASPGGVAITRCHIATAKHYPRGGQFLFFDRQGNPLVFNITGQADTPTYDIKMYRISPCLPPEISVYPLLALGDFVPPPGSSLNFELSGAPYINTHYSVVDYVRRISVTQINYGFSTSIYGAMNAAIPDGMQVQAVNGDSGSPSLVYFDGRLVVMSTFTSGGYGGGGPNYGHGILQNGVLSGVQAEIDAAIKALP